MGSSSKAEDSQVKDSTVKSYASAVSTGGTRRNAGYIKPRSQPWQQQQFPRWGRHQQHQQHQQQHQHQRRSPGGSKSISPPPLLLASGKIHEPPKAEDLPNPPEDWLILAKSVDESELVTEKLKSDNQFERPMLSLQQQCVTATLALKQLLHLQS